MIWGDDLPRDGSGLKEAGELTSTSLFPAFFPLGSAPSLVTRTIRDSSGRSTSFPSSSTTRRISPRNAGRSVLASFSVPTACQPVRGRDQAFPPPALSRDDHAGSQTDHTTIATPRSCNEGSSADLTLLPDDSDPTRVRSRGSLSSPNSASSTRTDSSAEQAQTSLTSRQDMQYVNLSVWYAAWTGSVTARDADSTPPVVILCPSCLIALNPPPDRSLDHLFFPRR